MIDDRETTYLREARRRVAELKPGCAIAILSDDPLRNWDRGRLVQDEVANMRILGEKPE